MYVLLTISVDPEDITVYDLIPFETFEEASNAFFEKKEKWVNQRKTIENFKITEYIHEDIETKNYRYLHLLFDETREYILSVEKL